MRVVVRENNQTLISVAERSHRIACTVGKRVGDTTGSEDILPLIMRHIEPRSVRGAVTIKSKQIFFTITLVIANVIILMRCKLPVTIDILQIAFRELDFAAVRVDGEYSAEHIGC